MRFLSGRAQLQLWSLDNAMLRAAADRNAALRVLLASRHVTTISAQRDFWLEFAWLNQEYRAALRALAEFCEKRDIRD